MRGLVLQRCRCTFLQVCLVLWASLGCSAYTLAPATFPGRFPRQASSGQIQQQWARRGPASRRVGRPLSGASSTVSALSTEREMPAVKLEDMARDGGQGNAQERSRKSEGDRLDDLAKQAAKSADMGLRYDPLVAEEEYGGRTLDVWKRDLEISVPLTTFLGQVLIDFQRGVEQQNRPIRAKQFMEIIAGLGPAFIKAGQALSSRPDLLPPEYLKELQKLQDQLPPFPNDVAFRIIEEQLGVPLDQVFERVEPEPVAAASIGQVYKGYLRTGEAVAIKVQRPECEDVIGLDIYILRELSGTLSQMIKLLRSAE